MPPPQLNSRAQRLRDVDRVSQVIEAKGTEAGTHHASAGISIHGQTTVLPAIGNEAVKNQAELVNGRGRDERRRGSRCRGCVQLLHRERERCRVVGEKAAELCLEHVQSGRQEATVEVTGRFLEPLEGDGEVGEEPWVSEVMVAEVLDDVRKPLRGEAGVIGEEPEGLL
ncbi:Os02g0149750, partial [Oryza sativa Japonica Group]